MALLKKSETGLASLNFCTWVYDLHTVAVPCRWDLFLHMREHCHSHAAGNDPPLPLFPYPPPHTPLWQTLLDICYDSDDCAICYGRLCWEGGGIQTCNNAPAIEFQSAAVARVFTSLITKAVDTEVEDRDENVQYTGLYCSDKTDPGFGQTRNTAPISRRYSTVQPNTAKGTKLWHFYSQHIKISNPHRMALPLTRTMQQTFNKLNSKTQLT